MSPCELAAAVNALAIAIAETLNDEEIAVAAAVFVQLGDTLETISAQREVSCGKKTECVS